MSWDLFSCLQPRAGSLLACDLSCYLLRVCHGVAARIGSIDIDSKSPESNVSVSSLNTHTLTRVVSRQSEIWYKYRATGCYGLHSMFQTYWSCPYDSMSLSNIMLLEDHESHASVLISHKMSQGLTCVKSHNTNPYKSPKHPKTTEKKCSSFTNMHDWPALIWQRPRKATPSWTENRECPRLKVMLIIETSNDTSGQLSI